jgi:prevent-host-death family protein
MKTVGSREFKNRMGRYMRAVRAGQTLIVTDRGKAVAKVAPATDIEAEETPLKKRLKELEGQGLIRLGTKPLRKFRPVKVKGKPVSQTIIEDRR